jgi:hypothetical protein
MVGITLAPEQIRAAPPEVRHWLEQQIAQTLGLQRQAEALPVPPRLVACTPEQAGAILAQIQGMLPVVAVFFELGREQGSVAIEGMRAFRLVDIARHARLPAVELVLQSLAVIDTALQRAIGDAEATLYALDSQGHCFVAEATSRSIFALWQGMITGGQSGPHTVESATAPQRSPAPGPAGAALSG